MTSRFAPVQELSSTRLTDELPVFDDDLAAEGHRARQTSDLPTLVQRVIDGVMERRLGDGHLGVRIPDEDIGVAPDRDRALLRVKTEHARRARGDEVDEPVESE